MTLENCGMHFPVITSTEVVEESTAPGTRIKGVVTRLQSGAAVYSAVPFQSDFSFIPTFSLSVSRSLWLTPRQR